MSDDLKTLRDTVSKLLIPVLWLHVVLVTLVAAMLGRGWMPGCLLAAAVAAIATAVWLRVPSSRSSRLTIAVAFIGMVSILLAECRDTECQIDIHMYYFVAMAILAIYCDWQVVLAAAAATILHHFVMNTVAPNLVFPDGSDLRRVGLHAVVVVFEAGALMWMGQRITTLFAASAEHLAQVKAASQAAAEARAELDARRQAADRERQARLEEVARQIRTVQ